MTSAQKKAKKNPAVKHQGPVARQILHNLIDFFKEIYQKKELFVVRKKSLQHEINT